MGGDLGNWCLKWACLPPAPKSFAPTIHCANIHCADDVQKLSLIKAGLPCSCSGDWGLLEGVWMWVFSIALLNKLPVFPPSIQDFSGSSFSKESTRNAVDWIGFPGGKDPLKKKMATHSSILAWETVTEESGGLQSIRLQESDTTEWLNHQHHHQWSVGLLKICFGERLRLLWGISLFWLHLQPGQWVRPAIWDSLETPASHRLPTGSLSPYQACARTTRDRADENGGKWDKRGAMSFFSFQL